MEWLCSILTPSGSKWRCAIPKSKQAPAAPAAKTSAPEPINQADQARGFAIEAARLAADTHCQNVVILDLRGLSQVTDYFVLATGTSARQMRSVSDEIVELGKTQKYRALERSGYEGESWILTDFVDVILHIFDPAARSYYDLDNLWGDAVRVEWRREIPMTKSQIPIKSQAPKSNDQ